MGYTFYGMGSLNGIDLAAKGILPIDPKFNLFGKFGVSHIYQGRNSGQFPYLGIGGAYSINPLLDVTVQAQSASDPFDSIGLLSTGLTYYFS
jgi:hypothetical protein